MFLKRLFKQKDRTNELRELIDQRIEYYSDKISMVVKKYSPKPDDLDAVDVEGRKLVQSAKGYRQLGMITQQETEAYRESKDRLSQLRRDLFDEVD